MPIFAALIPTLISFLVSAAGSILGSALIGLGIGVVDYTGFNELLSLIMSQVLSRFSSLSPDLITKMSLLQVDTCFSILTSACCI